MRIYKMTATFGKLEHETLTLTPGLNIITAPNEWGKSTWCAFLVAMLYGLDTRAKTTKTALADKERYQPWSGSPMSGRIDLNWNGRDITIERATRRRVPLGEFKAYETVSGLPVEELTAANCGSVLLGVEQTVFRRAGFIRFSDLPVTQDEALRRRLNALVTTGDDSGAADRLAASLKDLKNRCRYNRTGLLPQAEAQRDAIEEKLTELETLNTQCQKLKMRIDEVKDWLRQLYNHQQALAYAKMESGLNQIAQTREAMEETEQTLRALEAACASLPPQAEVETKVRELRAFRDQWNAIRAEERQAPTEPQKPELPNPFTGLTAEAARAMAREDARELTELSQSKMPLIFMIIGAMGLLAAGGLAYLTAYVFAVVAGGVGLLALIWGVIDRVTTRKKALAIVEKYGTADWKQWTAPISEYEQEMIAYGEALKLYQEVSSDLEVRLMVLRKKRDSLCGLQEPEEVLDFWQEAQRQWEQYDRMRAEAVTAKRHLEALNAVVKPVEKPTTPDNLTQNEAQTAQLLAECAAEQQRLQNRLGQYQGRMEIIGSAEDLRLQHKRVCDRIARLEDTYTALTIAQETLTQARSELQRRFAPRITQRAQELLGAMTDGRYQSLTMGEDFSLRASAGQEDVQCDAIWRSDGTIDQLYLALRLAVAEELTPDAPLVLDDALVRFDDTRMAAALTILRKMAENKQVICFTCQGREAKA
ncbi:MAG: AAA family ATPase [Clostridiales bacterium]|nr:AAA family ATPase [Clostridiales bacterium]